MTQPPTDDELLLINCMLYSNTFDTGVNGTVGEWARYMLDHQDAVDAVFSNGLPGEMTQYEFFEVLDTVKNDPNFNRMKIQDVEVHSASPLSPGAENEKIVLATIDYDGQPIIMYKGTGGDIEWRDNGVGGYYDVTDTREQQYAVEYFNKAMLDYPGQQAYVSGHSKGGNLAQYVTIREGDQVAQCFSFDGQGFNQAFYAKYAEQVRLNGTKIVNTSNPSDFVNIIFGSVPGSHQMYTGDGDILTIADLKHSIRRFHSPFTILSGSGNELFISDENKTDSPGTVMSFMDDFVRFAQLFMTKEDFQYLCWYVMGLLMDNKDQYGEPIMEPEGFWQRVISMAKNYAECSGLDPIDVFTTIVVVLGVAAPVPGGPVVGGLVGIPAGISATALYSMIPSSGFTTVPREFTQEVLDQLVALADETSAEGFFSVLADAFTDAYSHLKQWLGGLDFPTDATDRNKYYREMIDMDNISAQKFRQIWDDVSAKDSEFAAAIQGYTSRVEDIKRKADTFAETIRTS